MLETLHFFCPLHHVFTSANRLVDNMAMTKSTLASGLLFFPVQFRRQGRFQNIKIYAYRGWGGGGGIVCYIVCLLHFCVESEYTRKSYKI